MREAYGLYLSYKLFPDSPGARVVFVWSRMGILAVALANAVRRRTLSECRSLLHSFRFVLVHRAQLRAGDLGDTNREIIDLRRSS